MEGCSMNDDGVLCPKLLDLIPQEREWFVMKEDDGERGSSSSHGGSSSSYEKKLELRLAPPGEEENWSNTITKTNRETHNHSLLSLGYFSSLDKNIHQHGSVLSSSSPWSHHHHSTKTITTIISSSSFLQQGLPVMAKESSQQHCSTKMADQQMKKPFPSLPPANTAVPNTSQKRTAPGPVVGWPPIRSFRKNLATKQQQSTESCDLVSNEKGCGGNPVVDSESNRKGLFVKINMDGVPIGRKIDLQAYDSYHKLSSAVDELFRDLLAAQRNNKVVEEKSITGVGDENGEYTLVYEDHEGDRMLVGDVPWEMFISTVKRLRVLKTSELSALRLGSNKLNKTAI